MAQRKPQIKKPSKKHTKTYEKWTQELVENLATYFDLTGWTLYVTWTDKPDEEPCGCTEEYARISVNSPYQQAASRSSQL